ncbi:MAG: hypothetical protein JWQ07_4033 [Ramlibacter sp.]|nr:hypothetical protein [Ramlibacter sp.]
MRDQDRPHPDKRLMLKALAAGLMGARPLAASSQLLGRIPAPLPPGQSIYDLRGPVTVNNNPATMETAIRAGDVVATGPSGTVVFVVGPDAFLLRENSQLRLEGDSLLLDSLNLVTGAVLSVFGKSQHKLVMPTATIGIRGTGLYAVAQPDLSYLCTCYGVVDIQATGSDQAETIASTHHDAPRYIAADGDQRIRPAPFIDHTDDELMLIETLVGRRPPFSLFDPGYGGRPRY